MHMESKRANLGRDACRSREEVTVDGETIVACTHGSDESATPYCKLRRLFIETVQNSAITGGVSEHLGKRAMLSTRRFDSETDAMQ